MPYIYKSKNIRKNNYISRNSEESHKKIRDSVKNLNTNLEKNNKKKKFSISTFLMIIFDIFFCKCCIYKIKENKIKKKLNEQYQEILDNKLDIFRYIRNMILLEIMNKLLIDDKDKKCINYLSRSLIYLDHKIDDNNEEDFYESSEKLSSNELIRIIKELDEKQDKAKIEEKIISLIKYH
jgi:hypothetical protein